MPRTLKEYTAADWLHLRPVTHPYKHARFLLIYALATRRCALVGDVDSIIAAVRAKKLLTTIAFHDADKIAIQVKAVKAFVPGCIHLIADNSSNDEKADKIRRVTDDGGAIYLRLPANPWHGGNAGLSHGLGMTWVWRNVVKPAKPQAFGFLDHDIYPTTSTDPFAPLEDYPVAGRVWIRPPRWHLWAGFCFFRFDYVADKRLNFIRDWFARLDTGGGNWSPLYRQLDAAKITDPGCRVEPILPNVSADDCSVEWLGPWLHESNDWRHLHGTPSRDFASEKFSVVSRKIAELTAAATQGSP